MFKLLHKKYKAFSLIEVLFYISMMSVFILVISSFWSTLNEVQQRGRAMSAVDSEASFILSKLTYDIRNANSITTPSVGTSGNTLSLTNTEIEDNPLIYILTGGNLQMSKGNDPYIDLNSDKLSITNLSFSNFTRPDGKGVIKIQLTITYVDQAGADNLNYSQTYYATANLR